MSKDPRDKEEEFIAGLAEDTGRPLAVWMSLIDQQTFAHRNDMIDWLRQQGLTFAKASRLERIHHNGGKPVYGERPAGQGAQPAVVASKRPPPALPEAIPVAAPRAQPSVVTGSGPGPAPLAPPATADELAAFLAKAKGYRPLAELLVRTLKTTVRATVLVVHETHADLAAPAVYGAIAVTAKDVRLALDLGDEPLEGEFKRLRLPGIPAALTHTIVLNDARRIDSALMALVAKAANRANS
jgi:hypothetical protein